MLRLTILLFSITTLLSTIEAQPNLFEFSKGFNANNNAQRFLNQGNFAEAISEARRGKEAFQKAGWGDGYLWSNNMLVSSFTKSLQIDSAKHYAKKGLEALDYYSIGNITEAGVYYAAANLYAIERKVDSAVVLAKKIYPLLQNPTFMDTTGIPDFLKIGVAASTISGRVDEIKYIIQGNTDNLIGATYLATYDLGLAKNYFGPAAESYRQAKEYLDEAGAYFNLAMIYFGEFQFEQIEKDTIAFYEAEKNFKLAIKTAQKSEEERNALIGYFHFHLGKLYHLDDQYDLGQNHLAISHQLISENDQVALTRKCGIDGPFIELMVKLEELYERSAENQKMLDETELGELEDQLWGLVESSNYVDLKIYNILFSKLGQIHTNLKNWDRAYSLFLTAFQQNHQDVHFDEIDSTFFAASLVEQVDLDMMVLWHVAKMFEAQALDQDESNLMEKSHRFYRLAGFALERNRPQYGYQGGFGHLGQTGQTNLNNYAHQIYMGAIRTGFRRDSVISVEDAFNFMERSKAIIFRNKLKIKEILKQALPGVQEEFNKWNTQLAVADLISKDSEKNGKEYEKKYKQEKLLELQKKYEQFIDSIFKKNINPNIMRETEWLSLKELRNELLEDSCLIMTFGFDYDEDLLHILWTDKRGSQGTEILSIPKEFEEWVNQYRNFLEDKSPSRGQLNNYFVSAYRLYKLLFAPVLKGKDNVRHLIILPTAQLNHLSLDALLINDYRKKDLPDFGELPYLIRKYSIRYGYSSQSLLEQSKLIYSGYGNSYLDYGGFEPNYDDWEASDFDPIIDKEILESFAREGGITNYPLVSDTEKLFSSNKWTKIWLDKEAKEASFRNILNQNTFKIFHLSAHGFLNKRNPFESNILLTKTVPREKSYQFDDKLTVTELSGMNIRVNLLVVNSCHSAAGILQTGEGLSSISRGFAFAGCPSILAGMWLIKYDATKELLPSFFANLDTQTPLAQALQKAKIEYLSNPNSNNFDKSPYFWAGLVLWGKNTPLFSE